MTLIGEALVRVRPDTTAFRLETQKGVSAALTGLGGLGALGQSLRFTGAAAGIGAIALGSKEAISSAASLEQELNILQATAGATSEEMERVSQTAKDLGSDLQLPAVSATDAADAMLQLVKGGLDVEDAIEGARGTLQLGTAANLEFGESANIVARALTTFRRPGEDATEVADLLVGAAQAATGEVTDMAEALSAGGATAAQFGVSLEDTITALTLLARNGILGAEAGTGLRRVLLQLVPTTKEQADLLKQLGVEAFDAAGNLRSLPDIFQDFQDAFAGLTQEAQADTLNKIFGAFGIQAASVFIREGADATRELRTELTRGGQAAEFSEARTKGLSGAAAGLSSQLETLGTNIGQIAVPGLTTLTGALADAAGAANTALEALKGLGRGEALGPDQNAEANLSHFEERLNARTGAAEKLNAQERRDAKAAVDVAVGFFSATEVLTHGLRKGGEEAGKALIAGVTAGIISKEQESVNAARSTLAQVIREGDRAVAEAIRQGNEAVRLSAIQARQNLVSIGSDLAIQAAQIIDEGPLGRRIEELRASLTQGQDASQRQRLQEGLRQARADLESAQRSVGGGTTKRGPEQQAFIDEFLKPREQALKDARAALEEFDTEGIIGQLQEQADAQKKVVAEGIANLITQFNRGGRSLADLTVGIASLLSRNGVNPFGKAGKDLGEALRTKFAVELEGLKKQALEIATGLFVGVTGLEPTTVSPGGERRDQNANIGQVQRSVEQRVTDARASLVRAQNELKRSTEDNTTELSENTTAIKLLTARLPAPPKARSATDLSTAIPSRK